MELSLFTINRNTVISWYLFIITMNLILGFFFWAVKIDQAGLRYHLVAHQIGGLITASVVLAALYLLNPRNRMVRFTVILLSIFAGALIAALFDMKAGELMYIHILVAVLVGSIIYGSAFYWESMAATRANLEKAQIRRLQIEKRISEARLRTLQAQIEPHFLFNTLSNILNLFDTDIEKGKSMQRDLIRYLESSLSKIRTDFSTLGEEIGLVAAYLNIFKVRMEDRLFFSVKIPESLKKTPFPPMLIQPLVENAIKHGIEPKVEGGRIEIAITEESRNLTVIVADTGLGIRPGKGTGTGLANVRERLALIYGNAGRLGLSENQPCGIRATISVPHPEVGHGPV